MWASGASLVTLELRREAMREVNSGNCMEALVCGRELSNCREARQSVLCKTCWCCGRGERAVNGALASGLSGSGPEWGMATVDVLEEL